MLTPSKWMWWCCVWWLHSADLRVDILCVWCHYPNGRGGVVCVGFTVLCYEVTCCVYGDTIQMLMVFCALVALFCIAWWYLVYIMTPSKWKWWCSVGWLHCTELRVDFLCIKWHHPLVYIVTPFKWTRWFCMCWLNCAELRVDMPCVLWHHPNGNGNVGCAGCT